MKKKGTFPSNIARCDVRLPDVDFFWIIPSYIFAKSLFKRNIEVNISQRVRKYFESAIFVTFVVE